MRGSATHPVAAFALPPIALHQAPHRAQSPRRPPPIKLQLARLRLHLHLHRLRATRESSQPTEPEKPRRQYTSEERARRSERLRTKWADPDWRAAMLARRRTADTQQKMSDAAKRLWRDPDFRTRMRAARLGRPAPNKGVSPSAVTRLRMSNARKGGSFSEATRRKMSQAKLKRPEGDTWRKLISESKRGKTKEYFQMRREFRALHRDLKLWSDSYRAKYGKLPDANTYESFVAPMMILRIRRYLVLRETIGEDEPDLRRDIITRRYLVMSKVEPRCMRDKPSVPDWFKDRLRVQNPVFLGKALDMVSLWASLRLAFDWISYPVFGRQ